MGATRWPAEIVATECRMPAHTLADAWGEFLGRVPWESFATLTFSPRLVSDVSQDLARDESIWWCHQTARILRRPVGWLVAPERGRGGRWHSHVLLVGTGGDLGDAPGAMWNQRCGRIDFQTVYNAPGAVLYTTKSAASIGEVTLSDTLKRYRPCLLEKPALALWPEESSSE